MTRGRNDFAFKIMVLLVLFYWAKTIKKASQREREREKEFSSMGEWGANCCVFLSFDDAKTGRKPLHSALEFDRRIDDAMILPVV